MKRILLAILFSTVFIFAVYFIGSGFIKASPVSVCDFSVSDDGSEITLHLFVSSSAGFIRKVAVHQQHDGKLYLDCYSAFGGFNGSIGAKSVYTLPLSEDTDTIAICQNNDCYKVVLQKDDSGNWSLVKQKI